MILREKQIFDDIREDVLRLLEEGLSSDLIYHNPEHTRSVLSAVEWLCAEENISEADTRMLLTAAVFHDTGFLKTYDDHERQSCRIARKYLTARGLTQVEITQVEDLILATRIPQKPKNQLEEILCDADLNYLGTNDFYKIGDRLRKELILYGKLDLEETSWLHYQIRFLEKHQYFTPTCQQLREPVKQEFLSQLKAALKQAGR